ncbi:MAG: PAS domain S-box protein, partial [Burkholderiaceae bacterium]
MKDRVIEGQSLEWLLGSATDAMLIINREGEIILANPASERLFGFQSGELVGNPIEILIPARFGHAHQSHRSDYFNHLTPRAM